MKNRTNIIVNLQIPGIHAWPGVPADLKPMVGYLGDSHRHIFHIQVKKEVNHDDRDVEIINFKNQIDRYLREKYWNEDTGCCHFDSMSCEMIAEELLEKFDAVYCQVLEDGENGAEKYKVFVRTTDLATGDVVEGMTAGLISKPDRGIIFISSFLCGGKSFLARKLASSLHGVHIEISDIVKDLVPTNTGLRGQLQGRPHLDAEIIQKLRERLSETNCPVVISGVRQTSILEAFPHASCMWLDTPVATRYQRYLDSIKDLEKTEEGFNKANQLDIELGILEVRKYMHQEPEFI